VKIARSMDTACTLAKANENFIPGKIPCGRGYAIPNLHLEHLSDISRKHVDTVVEDSVRRQERGFCGRQATFWCLGGRLRAPPFSGQLHGPLSFGVSTLENRPSLNSYDSKVNRLFAVFAQGPRRCSATIHTLPRRAIPTRMPSAADCEAMPRGISNF
jgi:hypothetical protein